MTPAKAVDKTIQTAAARGTSHVCARASDRRLLFNTTADVHAYFRACERCKKIKVKCEYPTGVKTCNRCSKMGLTCVPGKQKERKVRPRLSAYDQVMDVGSSSGGQK